MTPRADVAATFTLRQVQAMLGLSRSVVNRLMQAGFVAPSRGPHNAWRFTFQDLMVLRMAHGLQASRIPPRKILSALARLKSRLPPTLPLSGLRITAIGADVVVRARDGQWQADDGQLLMDFEVAPVAGSVTVLDRAPAQPARGQAAAWFARGVALEAVDASAAAAAYQQALALAPDLVQAYLNLGAMWSDAGRFAELAALSERAIAHCPDAALLHFNQAVALDHLERLAEAVASYERSLALDPTLADAHYNLGRLNEQLGDRRRALRHFSAYRRLLR